MISFKGSGSVYLGGKELIGYSLEGPGDENKNGKPDVSIEFRAIGRSVYSGVVDVPIEDAIATVVGVLNMVAGKLPFPIPRLPGR